MEQDQPIIMAARAGDARAFRDLLDRYYSTIYKMAFTLCRSQPDAEDITQTVCLKLATVLVQFDGRSSFSTWLYRIVFNAVADWRRGQKQTVDIDNTNLPSSSNPEQDTANRERLAAVDRLPVEERDALMLVFAQGLSHKEAGLVLGCAESTVSWRIHEARRKLTDSEGGKRHAGS